MKILKKKTSEIALGDIFVLDINDIVNKKYPLTIRGPIKKLEKKCEGESGVFLFEVDDTELHFHDPENESGTIYTFYHMEEMMSNYPNIIVEQNDDYLWDIIENPIVESEQQTSL